MCQLLDAMNLVPVSTTFHAVDEIDSDDQARKGDKGQRGLEDPGSNPDDTPDPQEEKVRYSQATAGSV